MSNVYSSKEGSFISKKDAPIIGDILDKLKNKDGFVPPQTLVNFDKKNPNTPLRKHITWDDAECGRAHRLQQARQIIAQIVLVRPQFPHPPKVWYPVLIQKNGKMKNGGYAHIDDIKENPNLLEQVTRGFLNYLQTGVARYGSLEALYPFNDEFREFVEKIEAKIQEAINLQKRKPKLKKHKREPVGV